MRTVCIRRTDRKNFCCGSGRHRMSLHRTECDERQFCSVPPAGMRGALALGARHQLQRGPRPQPTRSWVGKSRHPAKASHSTSCAPLVPTSRSDAKESAPRSFKIRAKTGHKARMGRGWAVSGKVYLPGRRPRCSISLKTHVSVVASGGTISGHAAQLPPDGRAADPSHRRRLRANSLLRRGILVARSDLTDFCTYLEPTPY